MSGSFKVSDNIEFTNVKWIIIKTKDMKTVEEKADEYLSKNMSARNASI